MCIVRLRHKNETAKCRFYAVPGDSQALLGMPDLELQGILNIMGEVLGGQQVDRKFNSQTIQLWDTSSYKANTNWGIKSDKVDVVDAKSNMLD